MKTHKDVDTQLPDNPMRPYANDATARLAYLEKSLKHIVLIGKAGAKPERMLYAAQECLGWREVWETEFALSNSGSEPTARTDARTRP